MHTTTAKKRKKTINARETMCLQITHIKSTTKYLTPITARTVAISISVNRFQNDSLRVSSVGHIARQHGHTRYGVTAFENRLPNNTAHTAAATGRIVGGQNAPPGEYPYQISLQVRGPGTITTMVQRINWLHNCGGSIVSHRNVITAAHCVTGWPVASLSIWAGTTQLNGNGTRFGVSSYLVHPKYVIVNTSDIAIITTSRSFTFVARRVMRFLLNDLRLRRIQVSFDI